MENQFLFQWGDNATSERQDDQDSERLPPNLEFESVPPDLETPNRPRPGVGITPQVESNIDVAMTDAVGETTLVRPIVSTESKSATRRRAKYAHLDWNAHKTSIKSLYMDQGKTLSETMESMNSRFSFNASEKLFKAKLKEWGWQKNLPTETALAMQRKAKRRKNDKGKDTIFTFGGRTWDTARVESTLSRTNKAKINLNEAEPPTPDGMSYETPKSPIEMPSAEENTATRHDAVVEISDGESSDGSNEGSIKETVDIPRPSSCSDTLLLTWRGHSASDLQAMWLRARAYGDSETCQEPENLMREVLEGMENLVGKTNHDTVKVAYELANLYASSDRIEMAVDVIQKVIQDHHNTWGYEDKRTQQSVMHAVELLNSWNRHDDALGLLSLSMERLQSCYSHTARAIRSGNKEKGKGVEKTVQESPFPDLNAVAESLIDDLSPISVGYGLEVARKHITAKGKAVEGLLCTIISQCKGRKNLRVQNLQARGELLKLYEQWGVAAERSAEFKQALGALRDEWKAYIWDETRFESLAFMEAALQLIANALKCGYHADAKGLFRDVADKADDVFGGDDERTVWILITIGLVYQTNMTWDDAEEWFDEAFAAALRNKDWGPKDGIVRCLQNAKDQRHFSYISDEGRPFKTIFGVSGIKIVPGRLHLE